MRTFVAAPKADGQYPGIWCYSDIFQLTPPLLRTCVRLAGYGFVAAAPEIYRRIEPPGTVIPFDDAGRTRGQQDAAKTPVAHFDADCRAGLDWVSIHPKVAPGKIGVVGFCIGGLLPVPTAVHPLYPAAVCYNPTALDHWRPPSGSRSGTVGHPTAILPSSLVVL